MYQLGYVIFRSLLGGNWKSYPGACRNYASLTFFFTALNLGISEYRGKAKVSETFVNALPPS